MAEETSPAEPAQAAKPKHAESAAMDITAQVNSVSRTLKIIDDKYYNLRKKVQLNEENSLAQDKKITDDIKVMDSDILEMKKEISDIKEKIRLIVKELKLTAKSEDVKVVQKYLDMWEPVEFITRNEAKKMIERAVDEKFK